MMKYCTIIIFFWFSVIKAQSMEYAYVADFGAKGDGKTDDTQAIQKAINSGKPVKLGAGVYRVSTLVLPYKFKGLSIDGVGYNHWNSDSGTVLKAIGKGAIFQPENGCDWVKIANLRLEGNHISEVGFNGVFGGGIIFDNIGVYHFTKVGILSRQGLLRINNSFIANNSIGVELYSDSTISNTEITGGEIGLKVVAGGNRINNLWLNASSKNLLVLEPLNEKTGHQNTSLVNLYLGEVQKSKDGQGNQILIKGNAVKRVQQVQISNSFLVHATPTQAPNRFFYIENADEIIINGLNVLGQHTYSQGENYTTNFVKGINAHHIKIVNNIVKGINGAAIEIDEKSYDWTISGNDFIDIAGTGNDAVIAMKQGGNRAIITGNRFIDYRNNKNVFALKLGDDDASIQFRDNFIHYPSRVIMSKGKVKDIELKNNFR